MMRFWDLIGTERQTASPPIKLAEWLGITGLLLLLGYCAYGLYFAPALFMDDWTSVVERIVTGDARWVDFSQRRFWLFSAFLAQNRLFGLNIPAYYLSLWLLYILQALTFYAIIRQLPLPHGRTFATIVAALFLVYPTNYTHMWLIMFGVYLATWLTLLAGYLFLRYGQSGRWRDYLLALLCLLYPLGIYEGQLGVMALWLLAMAVLWPGLARNRRLALLSPLLLMGLFGLWRVFGVQSVGVTDEYVARVVTSPLVLLQRLLLGYRISFVWGWTEPLAAVFTWAGSALRALLLMAAAVGACVGVTHLLGRWLAQPSSGESEPGSAVPWRLYLALFVFGVLLTGAGYVPILFVFLPSLSGIGSRFNLFASFGGAVTLASGLMLVSLLLTRRPRLQSLMAAAGAIPFLLVAVTFQASVQRHNQIAWQEQQQIWAQLFDAAPDLAEDTFVLFILPGMEDRTGFTNWQRTPLSASWEAASGVRLLYDNSTLAADVAFPDIEEPIEPELYADGVFTQEHGELTPYSRVVAFRYHSESRVLAPLAELPAAMIVDSEEPVRLCTTCVLDDPVSGVEWRQLVSDD